MSESDEQILDELMARNEQVVKSARDVLQETKVFMTKISKQERCRNLEFQMMKRSENESSIESDVDLKNRFLRDIKKKRDKKYISSPTDIKPEQIDETKSDDLKPSVGNDSVIVSPVNADVSTSSFVSTTNHASNMLHQAEDKSNQSNLMNEPNEVNNLICPRMHLDPRQLHYEYRYRPVPSVYQPVLLLPPDYCMYESSKQVYQPVRQQQHSNYLHNSISYLNNENVQNSGSDDELNGTRIIMKNKKTGYLCNLCGKIYCRKYVLKIHQRVHSGEKPLSCHICGKCFSDPSNLKKHVKLHDPEQAHLKCHLCPRQYTRRRSLVNHLEKFHGERSKFQGTLQEDLSSDETCESRDVD